MVLEGAVGISLNFNLPHWRIKTAKLLVYLLVAPLLVVIQGVAGPIQSAQAEIYSFQEHTFSSCNATGASGPSESACRSAYSTSWDESSANFYVVDGIQYWKVPKTGTYQIIANGAYGGGSYSEPYRAGYGASMQGDFVLQEGDILKILVGQLGAGGNGTGGGGGTFVTTNSNTPLVVAGGGGGGSGGGGYAGEPT